MGRPRARFLVFNMRQNSESLKSDPASSGLVQRGKKLADLEFFFVSINIPAQSIVTQPCPALVRRAGSLSPLLPGSCSQPGPSGGHSLG